MLSTIRHEEVFSAKDNDFPITIIGAGAIGSRIFAALAELGLTNINVYDFDKVEAHNLANQVYNAGDIGKFKVDALSDWYLQKMGCNAAPDKMWFNNTKVTTDIEIKSGVVFLLVDSLDARRQLFEENIKGNEYIYKVIDVRMAATHGNVFVFNPHTQGDAWLSTMGSDDEAEMSACGSSLTVGTTASVLSNVAVWQFMHAKTNPAAVDEISNVYLKPLTVTTDSLEKN